MGQIRPAIAVGLAIVLAGCVGVSPGSGLRTPDPSIDVEPSALLSSASPVLSSASPSADPKPTTTPIPTLRPVPSASPASTDPAPPGRMDRFVAVERDGVHVRVALERNPMPAGEWTRVTTEVRNTGSDTLTWFHDGCATLVSLYGEMADDWRPGVEQTGVAKQFKDRALDIAYRRDPRLGPVVYFLPEWAVGKGGYGCADVGIADEIPPGESLTAERVWDGHDSRRWGLPPSGPITLTASFQFYGRGSSGHATRSLDFEVASAVAGGVDPAWLSPPEVVDAALADRAFLDYVGTQDLGNGREEILWYRPTLRAWEVGVLVWYEEAKPMLHLVIVDPVTGEIVDRVDRPWDEDADGFP